MFAVKVWSFMDYYDGRLQKQEKQQIVPNKQYVARFWYIYNKQFG